MLSIGCLNFLFIKLDYSPNKTKVIKSFIEYEENKFFYKKNARENELLKLKWKDKEKSLANKKNLLSMCSSTRLRFNLKNENKQTLID